MDNATGSAKDNIEPSLSIFESMDIVLNSVVEWWWGDLNGWEWTMIILFSLCICRNRVLDPMNAI